MTKPQSVKLNITLFIVGLSSSIYYFISPDYKPLSLVIVLASLSLFPFFYSWRSPNIDYFEIIYPFSILFFITYPVRALFIIAKPEGFEWISSFVQYDDYLEIALVYSILGYIMFLLGYFSRIPRNISMILPRFRFLGDHSISFARASLVYAAGWLVRIVSLKLGHGLFRERSSLLQETGAFNYYVVSLGELSAYGLCLVALLYYSQTGAHEKKLRNLIWYVMLPLEIFYAVIFIAKSYLIIPIFILTAAFHYTRRRIRISGRLLIPVLLIVFVIFPFINFYRFSFSIIGLKSISSAGAIIYNVSKVFLELSSLSITEYVKLSINFLINRMGEIDKLCAAIKFTPAVRDFQYGKDWILIPALAYIPRFLWSTKPLVNYAVGFGYDYLGQTSGVSIGTGHLGDFYMNFGLIGILCGMFGLGLLFRLFYLYFISNGETTLPKIFIYIFLMWTMLNGFEGNIATIYADILKKSLILCGTLWIATKKRPFKVLHRTSVT